ncbi:MAG: adenylate/guanylate cyclase domain-containing protein [bacterium]|nr:adenylate/guanylate cyclase domain-containing protein [bacterium]
MKFVKNLKSLLIFVSILIFLIIGFFVSTSFWEQKAYNFMVQAFSAYKVGSDEIVLVVIDDKSLAKFRWPWKRELYSEVFDFINKSNSKVIGFDAIIATPDLENPKSDANFYKTLSETNNIVIGFVPLFSKYDNLNSGKKYDEDFKKKFAIEIDDKSQSKLPTFYNSLSEFPVDCFKNTKMTGSVLTTPDYDGYIRSLDQLVDYKGTLYPSLSLRMYMYLHPNSKLNLSDKYITAENTELKIPIYKKPNGVYNNIHYYKMLKNSEYSHKTYSAVDIIDSARAVKAGKKPIISPEVFDNKIVFVGANAKAIAVGLEDVKHTPMSNNFPGIDIQASNLDNLLHNEYLRLSTPMFDIVSLVIILLATFLTIKYFSLFVSISTIAVIALLYLVIAAICYRFGYVVNVLTPITLQVVVMSIAYSYRFILEGRNKEKIKNAMGKYISQDVMKNVVKNIDKLKLGGKRAEVTVLFADIRGFTSMSEKMSAEEVSLILNEYFTAVEPIITKYNGVINKFIGDAVMAIFGEPIQDKSHAVNAVKCAAEMLDKVAELHKKWLAEGKPKIEIGVGINTGEVFVGNIGSESRLEYTVIGDVVNLASRIESYNKVYKTKFLISSTTYQNVRNIANVIKISEVSIRGKQKKLDIYEVLRLQ